MYYAKEFSPGRWHVVNRANNHPVYDGSTNGDDKPLVFDEDNAATEVERLNQLEQPLPPSHQIAQHTTQTALERKLVSQLLKIDPGIGPKSVAIVSDLADSGFTPSAAALILRAVYSPTDPLGRGQAQRSKWFVQTIQNRYARRLDVIRKDPKAFRVFIAEMEEATEMRDTLAGEGLSISFESTFLLWELGHNADSIMGIVEQLCGDLKYRSTALKMVLRAAMSVKAGHFMELETAIESMRYGWQPESQSDRSN